MFDDRGGGAKALALEAVAVAETVVSIPDQRLIAAGVIAPITRAISLVG